MNSRHSWLYDLLLVLVLLVGAILRFGGLDWGEHHYQHPDELFLTTVETVLQVKECADPMIAVEACPPEQRRWLSLSDYFNTATSPLNPHNRGKTFFVYGTLPIFAVRYLAEWLGQTGYDQVQLLGRQLSALTDLGTILLLYIIASRIYGQKVGLLAAAFSALTVMQIQQSHFFTVDNFANLFIFLAIYFAVRVSAAAGAWDAREINSARRFIRHPLFGLSLGFGIMLGMAIASKLNAAPLAILLPGAFLIGLLGRSNALKKDDPAAIDRLVGLVIGYLVVGAFAALIAFRIFQPYAFNGLGFFGVTPNPQWLSNIRELRGQASGDADWPPNLQWVRRSHLFSFTNLTVWGLGLPLGILAWAGLLWMGWRILKGEWQKHLLLWGWTALYFIWQSLQFNPTMRYQLPIYPLLAMMASYFVFQVAGLRMKVKLSIFNLKPLAALLGIIALVVSAVWAFAFVSMYVRPETRVAASRWIYQHVPAPINLRIQTPEGGMYQQPLLFPYGSALQTGFPYDTSFVAQADGALTEIHLAHAADTAPLGPQTLRLSLAMQPEAPPDEILARAAVTADFVPQTDPRGEAVTLTLDRPVQVAKGQTYFLRLETTGEALALTGAAPVNETEWDLGLPFPIDSYNGYGGLYQGGLNFEMYWDDNSDKLTRFYSNLDQGDYLFISSNRQWATTVRVPERYPLTTAYYRALLGCPPDKDILWCYTVAEPGMFQGSLGFDLAAVFKSYPMLSIPGLGAWEINDQPAEEAFTVYDHPKVFIFQKRADYDPAQVRAVLGAVDLTHVIHLTPRQASSYPSDLMLPADRLAAQRAGGTWSELFDTQVIHNCYPAIGLALWYVFIFALGLFTYPLLRLALPGLADRGYPLARTMGMVLLAYFPWLAGSFAIPYTRLTIGITFGLVALLGLILAYCQRAELRREWKERRAYFLLIEGLFLAFFLLDLLIRLGNPDLWHPAKGGERPMNFSYFNAVLKSTTFPPYDPWFAGGYINYYYYGYVLVGAPVKLLGIVPSVAYNFILPTLFAMLALGAFSVGWNLSNKDEGGRLKVGKFILHPSACLSGLAASIAMVLLGNLGTVRMFYQGFQRVAAPGGIIDPANVFQRWLWAIAGLVKTLAGASLPFARGDFYWFPSRLIPAPGDVEPITEFPLFTFLYSDLHAHMIALPLAVLAIAWALSVVLARGKWAGPWAAAAGFALGGLAIGALYPANLSDIYTYLPLALLSLGYALWRYMTMTGRHGTQGLSGNTRRLLIIGAAVLLLTVLSFWLYQPYRAWYGQAYNKLDLWRGTHTPIWSYLAHWGLFLFVIVSWMTWETRQWMAATPVSALNKLRPYQLLIELAAALLLVALLSLAIFKIQVGWLALPLAAWAGVLLMRPHLPDTKRFVLFLVGTGLFITLLVEVIVVRGDIGRMNTVFKFYLQAWTLFAVSAAAAFGWLLPEISRWLPRWRSAWETTGVLLLIGACLFTLTATLDKVRDRMAAEAPHSLDSMTYMAYAHHWDSVDMDLSQDYRAIRWMQENVKGSPVIVEANTPEYRWGSRYTIYTGLPGVVGWNWHQRQQRALVPPNWITDRVDAIGNFYLTTSPQEALAFLQKYDVQYIVVGQLEEIYYPGPGLNKFVRFNGTYWQEVYRDGQTAIYAVNR